MKYVVSQEPTACKVLSAVLALGVHVGLLLFLMLGVQWATNELPAGDPLAVDLWGAADLAGAPAASSPVADLPVSEPVPLEPPVAASESQPVPESQSVPPPESQADIALKQAEKEAEEKERQERIRQREEEKRAREKARQQEKEKTIARALEKERAEAEKRARREATLRESLKRERANLQSGAGTGGTGTGSGRSGAGGVGLMREQAAYIARIRAIVTPNIRYDPNFAETVQGTPEATFEVSLLPDGTIGRVVLKQSTGNADYNRIIQAAINKTGRLPLPDRPEILPERRLNLYFRYP